ncbi:MAG: hypothetical protein ACRDCA_06840 [Serratia sp. (in: enterobacteria)]|uniref:hypothetical protein n=1 Tax=Serratia sp. (in: enterobacteria) TaxID=616 RepID=UPI003F41AE4F
MLESIGELLHMVFRVIVGTASFLLEVVCEIGDVLHISGSGKRRKRGGKLIPVLVFLAVLGVICWWLFY